MDDGAASAWRDRGLLLLLLPFSLLLLLPFSLLLLLPFSLLLLLLLVFAVFFVFVVFVVFFAFAAAVLIGGSGAGGGVYCGSDMASLRKAATHSGWFVATMFTTIDGTLPCTNNSNSNQDAAGAVIEKRVASANRAQPQPQPHNTNTATHEYIPLDRSQ